MTELLRVLLQVGNHITDRSSSRVLAPPGGASQVYFGDYGSTPEVRFRLQTTDFSLPSC